ncbi:MAG: cell division protein FtsQ [Prevotella sp.]|nr:cell division protein FtsQ [Prevotella sp.]
MHINWKKIFTVSFSVIIGVYLLLAITAFNHPIERDMTCRDVQVTIEGNATGGFLTPADICRMLTEQELYPVGKHLTDVNLRAIEERLEAQELIERVEAYKTQSGNVKISISERVPVMRVMANGQDYYVDRDGKALMNTGYVCNLIIATGSISQAYASRVLAPIGRIIMADDFWRNQIEQINVLPDSTVEMVPRVGGHIIYIGQPIGVTKKLERLRKFYRYGLSQAGWNKYSRISVEFNNQIVCKKKK